MPLGSSTPCSEGLSGWVNGVKQMVWFSIITLETEYTLAQHCDLHDAAVPNVQGGLKPILNHSPWRQEANNLTVYRGHQ
eukprot:c24191_g2_i1 orf=164-400(+)